MKYQVGDRIKTTKYGTGIIVNILELRNFVTCYETILDETNKKKTVFWTEIVEVIE